MVKVDVRRDYYADLGLVPSADTEDVKKQFRKLALKYHPDRNPGKEVEFNSKFQAIQAAHEILSDPTQRVKYDTDRLRAGYGKSYGASGPHNIPRKPSAASQAPAASGKPQRKPPFPPRPNSFQNTGGPQRYASYSRGAPQQPGQKAQDHGQTRADAYRGFQGMKGSSTGAPGWSQFDPKTGARSPQTNDGRTQRPKSAYEYFKASQNAANAKFNAQTPRKKQGFAPGTPGGDEPMASSTSAYTHTSRDRSNRWSSYFESSPSPTARKPTAQETGQSDKYGNFAERESSRYATSGGERTFFSSAAFGRSASMRGSPQRSRPASATGAGGADTANTGKHRSPSPKVERDSPRTSDATTSSSGTEDDDERPTLRPKGPRSRLRPHEKYANYRAGYDFNFATDPGFSRPFDAFTRKKIRLDADQDGDGLNEGHDSDGTAFAGGSQGPQTQSAAQETGHNFTENLGQDGPKGYGFDNIKFNGGSQRPSQFTPQAVPNSADNPNAASESQNWNFNSSSRGGFTAHDWHGAFQEDFVFRANGQAVSHPSKSQTPRPKSADTSRAGARKRPAEMPFRGPGNPPSRPGFPFQRKPAPFAEKAFSADNWIEQFRNMTWAMPKDDGPRDANSQASWPNSRESRSPKSQPRSARTRTPQTASVATEAEEAEVTVDLGGEQQSAKADAGGGEAMDIDDDQTANAGPGKESKDQSNGVPLPKPGAPSSDDRFKAPQPESGAFNMNNLGKTDPFTNTNSNGISNLQDIHATLPFESRPKSAKATASEMRPRELKCPNPPRRPRVPELTPISVGSQQLGLPRTAWERYVAEMNTYMREWNDFNSRMLGHFNVRQEAAKTGLAPGWISAIGDSARLDVDSQEENEEGKSGVHHLDDDILLPGTAKGGYRAYLRGLEEDVKVRKHWDVACEMHHECILQLGKTREWIRNGGKLI